MNSGEAPRGKRNLPNAVFIGPGKTGSTWLHRFCESHPEICVPRSKDIYFFDKNYTRGLDWYASHFKRCDGAERILDISHDYIVSNEAAERIKTSLPGVLLILILRNPIERSISAFKYRVAHGLCEPDFETAIAQDPKILTSSRYFHLLEENGFLKNFDVSDFRVFDFETLRVDPQDFANQLTSGIGVAPICLDGGLIQPVLPAAAPRSARAARLVKRVSLMARDAGLGRIVGEAKRIGVVRNALYRSPRHDDFSTTISLDLKDYFAADALRLDQHFGTSFARSWGFA